MAELTIRAAETRDLPRLNEIFNHYVANGHATFRTAPWTLAEREAWFAAYDGRRHHVLVGEADGTVQGCAYSSRYRPTPPFDTTVETSVYLDPACRTRGAGTALYAALLRHLEGQDVHAAVAGVALPNDASVALHRRLGFREVGVFEEYARKNGVWISSMWFQRMIAPGS
jgi:phosphinothricin acetyltransferase